MLRLAGNTGAIGIEIAVALAIGYFGGRWLDAKFGSAPWLMYFGLVCGAGAAIKALVRVSRQYKKLTEEPTDPPQDPPPR